MDKKAEIAIKALDSKKAVNIEVRRIGDLTVLADHFVIATGTSSTHVKALADEVEFKLHEAGFEPRQIEGYSTGWILLDYSDVVVHVFSPEQREHYSLEKLWADAVVEDISALVTED